MKVSFDFDETLDNEDVQKFAIELIKRGVEIWIHTARFPESEVRPRWNDDIYKVMYNIGIPRTNVVFTEMYDKYIFFKDKDFIWHLDNSSSTIKIINERTNTIGIHYITISKGNNWKKKCLKLLK